MSKWLSPVDKCDVCDKKIKSETFIDGKTTLGPWALMCEDCFDKVGIGLGTGFGQIYDTETKEKIDG